MIKDGANVNIETKHGTNAKLKEPIFRMSFNNPLFHAFKLGNPLLVLPMIQMTETCNKIVPLLVTAGADPNVADEGNVSPLGYAIIIGEICLLQFDSTSYLHKNVFMKRIRNGLFSFFSEQQYRIGEVFN